MASLFTRPEPNLIVSNSGFSVKILGRTGLQYCENNKELFIDSEVLAEPGIAIFSRSIKAWSPPFEHEHISESQKQKIIKNIKKAIEFCGERVEVL